MPPTQTTSDSSIKKGSTAISRPISVGRGHCKRLSVEHLFHHHSQVAQRLLAVSGKAGAVHSGQQFGFQMRETFQNASGIWRVGNVVGERAGLVVGQSGTHAAKDV